MATRNVRKNLAGMEDLLAGVGTVQQTRNGATYTIGKVDQSYAVNSETELKALDVTLFNNARIYSSATAYIEYRYDENDLTGIPPTSGAGTWIEIFNTATAVTVPTVIFPTVTAMLAAVNTTTPSLNETFSAGGTTFEVESISGPMTIEDFAALSDVNVAAFGAVQDDSDISAAVQAAVDYAAPRRVPVRIDGNYRIGATINCRNRMTINSFGSVIAVTPGIGTLFSAVATTLIAMGDVTIEGGEWYEDVAGGDETLGNVTFFNAQGDYNGGSIIFVWRTFINRVYAHGFNYFMISNWHRTWNVTNCFTKNRNGFRAEHKNVETNISNCLIFGTDTLATDTVGLDVGVGIVAATHPGMYPEGFKVNNCTIDQFYIGVHTHEVLDMNLYDCWVASGHTDAHLRWALKFEINATGNNFMTGVHYHNCTFARSLIEFVGHSGAPTQAFVKMTGCTYVSAQTITVGLRWYGIEFDDWTLNSVSPKLGIHCVQENQNCHFDNMKFKGSWSSLFNVGTLCTGTTLNDVWSDEFIDDPYFTETRVRITNSASGNPIDNGVSAGGQMILMSDIATALVGNDLYLSPNISFKVGALVELKIHGLVNSSSASGTIEITDSTGTVIEGASVGGGWDSKFILITNSQVRIDASYIFRCISSADTTIGIKSLTGDTTVAAHSYMTMRYI